MKYVWYFLISCVCFKSVPEVTAQPAHSSYHYFNPSTVKKVINRMIVLYPPVPMEKIDTSLLHQYGFRRSELDYYHPLRQFFVQDTLTRYTYVIQLWGLQRDQIEITISDALLRPSMILYFDRDAAIHKRTFCKNTDDLGRLGVVSPEQRANQIVGDVVRVLAIK